MSVEKEARTELNLSYDYSRANCVSAPECLLPLFMEKDLSRERVEDSEHVKHTVQDDFPASMGPRLGGRDLEDQIGTASSSHTDRHEPQDGCSVVKL